MSLDFQMERKEQGERDAVRKELFLHLLRTSYSAIYRAILTLVPAPSDADDVMQEVCVVMWKQFDDFEPGTNFTRWGRTIAFNLSRSHLRQSRKHRAGVIDEGAIAEVVRTSEGAQELLELRREYLNQCLQELKSPERTFVVECYRTGEKLTHVAKRLGEKVDRVYLRLSRIRRRLLSCIEKKIQAGGES
ncbi:sigma-70 family RNA polymerase sigma factor [Calycomorphotria hydatis]|uniref:ECF RNA polymerase sigma factor SigR n=1 Tax=Calycomorphotria hydatis TaxID=2528027 RepID=A0A517T4M5_9PLAN|nr:sigma-70 family RNA polymerase sigma factor [Calycomorphotria hydatis]QDT63327.1 ECF RNA polymerase sigma factor SigR [Calycomorphotria hydatis]